MAELPVHLKYTREHEWVRMEGAEAVIGITAYAAEQLGDVVFVELPAVGDDIVAGQPFGTVESVKSVSDLFAPINGTVVAVNAALADAPELVNDSPYDEAWMLRVRPANPAELEGLLEAAGYAAFLEEGD